MKIKSGKYLESVILPVILLILPLLRCFVGVDVTDTGYSLGSFIYQGGQMGEEWVKFATYLATVKGSVLARLPYGDTMMGMNFYTGLFVSATALLSYFFLKRMIPTGIAFIGVVLSISLCWCPTVILYNYMTYFLMTAMVVFLYIGICKDQKICYFLAGMIYGFNIMTRFPNITHGALILSLWYAGWLLKEKPVKVLQNTLYCIGGFLLGFLSVLGFISMKYGVQAYPRMLLSLFGGNGGVEGHSLKDMVWPIVDAYLVGFRWLSFILLLVAAGFFLFSLFPKRFLWIKRILYIGAFLVLLRFFYGRGMFNFRYYAYESMFQWLVIFLILSVVLCILKIVKKGVPDNEKILASMLLLLIVVTPLGSDNYLYPNINNLFLVAPVVLYWVAGYIKSESTVLTLFNNKVKLLAAPVKIILVLVLFVTIFQSVLFGANFVFRDGMTGEKRDTVITGNRVLHGMVTNEQNARTLEELTEFCKEQSLSDGTVILYGNVPALSCFMEIPTAISTSWTDLDSYSLTTMKHDLEKVEESMEKSEAKAPSIMVSTMFDAWLSEDAQAMSWYHITDATYREDEKALLLKEFIDKYGYVETFINEKFVVLQQASE